MSTLSVSIKTTDEFIIKDAEWLKLMVRVTTKRRNINNATVVFTVTNGKTGEFSESSVTTDKYGVAETRFQANDTGSFDIQATASKSGYTSGSFTISVLGLDTPTEFYTKDKLYLNLLEERKKNILRVLSDYLDNDRDFYRQTGASDRISYLTEWNFKHKDFPLIVASNEGPVVTFPGFNNIIDEATWGGFADVVFGLNIIAENKTVLDRLVEKCNFILSNYKYMELYGKYGITINLPITTGGLVTEPYGSEVLYANKLSVNTRLEFAYNIDASDTIESIYTTSSLVSGV
jgi:hypothetical protein